VRVIGAYVKTLVATAALESHPDVRLDVLHEVADVDWTVGVRQRAGNQNVSFFVAHSVDLIRHAAGKKGR
jgi:hypothetical protein